MKGMNANTETRSDVMENHFYKERQGRNGCALVGTQSHPIAPPAISLICLCTTQNPSSFPEPGRHPAADERTAGSDESSRRRLAGCGVGAAPSSMPRRRSIMPDEERAPHLLQRHHRAVPARETAPLGTTPVIIRGGDGVEAVHPVHPGHGRADDPGRAADQVPRRHQRGGHLRVRPAVGVRLVGGARGHHGVLHDRRGGHAADGGRERQVRQREAGQGGGQVRHAHGQGLGQVHEVHGALLPGQRPPVPQELK